MGRYVMIAGATGLVGRHLLQMLLDDPDVAGVVALTRRPLAIPHPKLTEALVDFTDLDSLALPPLDDYFCCLGTTIRQAGTQEALREVDLVYPLRIAQLALAAHASRCFFVSAMGADPHSRVFYNRVKGELESELARLPFRTVIAFRPSLLTGERREFRLGERVAQAALRPFAVLIPSRYQPVEAAAVARAMAAAAQRETFGRQVVESDAIRRPGAAVAPLQE